MQAGTAGVWGTEGARAVQGQGAGGDGTVYVDSVAEAIVLRVLEEEHLGGRNFQLISEEVGERSYGEGGDLIVVDPIDGSHNAKMGIPYFSLTLAAAGDRTFGSVREGVVRNLATGDTYRAVAGAGATLNGAPLRLDPDGPAHINVVQVEPTRIEENLDRWVGLMLQAEKVRMLGSAALNICLVATGALSVSVAPTLRSVDCVAPLLVLREAGGIATGLDGAPIDGVDMGLANRTSVIAAANRAVHTRALQSIRAGTPTSSGAELRREPVTKGAGSAWPQGGRAGRSRRKLRRRCVRAPPSGSVPSALGTEAKTPPEVAAVREAGGALTPRGGQYR